MVDRISANWPLTPGWCVRCRASGKLSIGPTHWASRLGGMRHTLKIEYTSIIIKPPMFSVYLCTLWYLFSFLKEKSILLKFEENRFKINYTYNSIQFFIIVIKLHYFQHHQKALTNTHTTNTNTLTYIKVVHQFFCVFWGPLYTCLLPFLGLMLSLLSMGRDSLDRTSSAPWEAAVPRSRAVSSPDMASMASSWALLFRSSMSFSWACCLAYIDIWWHQKHI